MHPPLRLRGSWGRKFFLRRRGGFRQAELGEEGGLVLVGVGLGACDAGEDGEDLGVAGGVDLAVEEDFVHNGVYFQ